MEKWWNEICGRGKREKPREKPTQIPFRPPRNPHGGTETRTRDPSGGRRAANRLRHEAATNVTLYDIKFTFRLYPINSISTVLGFSEPSLFEVP